MDDRKARMLTVASGFFILVFVLPFPASGQTPTTIHTVHWIGCDKVPEEEVNSIAALTGQPYTADAVQQALQRVTTLYASMGYWEATVDSVAGSLDSVRNIATLTMFVSEGRQAVVGDIVIQGNASIGRSELVSVMEIAPGSPYVSATIEEGIERMLKLYEQHGYAFARAIVDSVSWRENNDLPTADIFLTVAEGDLVRISELRIDGNKSTRTDVITREARLRANEIYRSDLPERIKRRLDRMQLFSSVSTPELYVNQRDKAGLFIRVAEGSYNTFDGIVGYVPASGSQSEGYVTGLVNLQFRNLFGTNRRLSARWFRENRSTQEIELQYFEPWVASYPVNASVGFFQRKQDSTYVRTRLDLQADFMVTEDLSVGATFNQFSVVPSEGYGQLVMPESKTTNVGVSLRYDTRDNPITPTSGVLYVTDYRTGAKRTLALGTIVPESKSTTQRITFDAAFYLSPLSKQVLATELHLREYSSSSIDISDLFRIGGASTLRGYREGQFLGSRVAWTNLEYRFLAGQRSFFYGFVDAGYILYPDNVIPSGGLGFTQHKVGYGVGVRVDSGIGLIGVSLALGEGDTFSTAKLHLRLTNEF